jgi:hypothetical protein
MVNESYFANHDYPRDNRRKRRRRASEYDPKASKSDIHYEDTYGL